MPLIGEKPNFVNKNLKKILILVRSKPTKDCDTFHDCRIILDFITIFLDKYE